MGGKGDHRMSKRVQAALLNVIIVCAFCLLLSLLPVPKYLAEFYPYFYIPIFIAIFLFVAEVQGRMGMAIEWERYTPKNLMYRIKYFTVVLFLELWF
jgi:hypothetical protein